jgi:ribose 5-phosphate isomerase A
METAKKAAGEKAAALIQNGMVVGLGTGTTAAYFIQSLIHKCHQGLEIQAVASSDQSFKLAKAGNIPLIDINTIEAIDLTVDGADEIDPQKQMIKGGGGALLREKIVACMSREMVVIVDETKVVDRLGKCKLPVEIIPFGHPATIRKLNHLGYRGALRQTAEKKLFVTDNGNYIYDIHLNPQKCRPIEDHEMIIQIPGVVETGFFFNIAGRVIVGFLDGQAVIQ